MFYVFDIEGFLVDWLCSKSVTLSKYFTNKIKLQDVLINNALGIISFTGPGSSVPRGMGGHQFACGPRHIKVIKNGTSCTSPGTQS